ncbi:MAG TPA: hypothetical protein VFT62_10180 [Mycobacteriales bacterium]|nr:hypothetical protein [Mycobacteriales bacterium]
MNRLLRPVATSLVLLPAVALVAACGSGSNGIEKLSGAQALKKVQAATRSVQWVHVKGRLDQGAGHTVQIDLHLGDGKAVGTATVGNGTLDVRLLNGLVYFRGNAAAFSALGASSAETASVAGKWLKSDATTGPFAGLSAFRDLHSAFQALLRPSGKLEAGPVTTINGQKVATIIEVSDGSKLYVADTGQPLPVRIERSGAQSGRIDFTDYGKAVSVQAPPNAIDLNQAG